MSARMPPRLRRFVKGASPFAILATLMVAFVALPLYSNDTATEFNVYNTFQSTASVGLLALAVGLSMLAGEFDLSTVGMYGLGGMLAVKFGVDTPLLGVAVALGAGAIVGIVQGGIIAKLKISSVPVTLGGYIALLGLTSVLSGGESIAYDNLSAGLWLEQQIGTVLSPRSLIMFAVFAVVAGLLYWTRIGRDLRAVGNDRRASRAAGVRTDRVLICTFMSTALISALAGSLLAYSIATAKPDPGAAPLVFAVTAALLGGVTLAGGKGTALGVLAGALSLSLLQEIFVIVATPDYVSNLVLGSLLVVVVAMDAPHLRDRLVTVRLRLAERAAPNRPTNLAKEE